MIYISHRGYIEGPDIQLENNPKNIEYLINRNIQVEIDIRFFKNDFYLGHDEPSFKVTKKFLENKNLWCHAKDHIALNELKNTNSHFFWHQDDDYTLTSQGFIWVYPGKPLIKNCIAVMPENYYEDFSICHGICTDNIKSYYKDL